MDNNLFNYRLEDHQDIYTPFFPNQAQFSNESFEKIKINHQRKLSKKKMK